MLVVYLDHINQYIQHRKSSVFGCPIPEHHNCLQGPNIARDLERSDQSLPHQPLFPNEYNQVGPLLNQGEMDSKDNNVSTGDSDEN